MTNKGTSSLNEWDVWTLRVALEVYGCFCFTFILNPLLKKVLVEKSIMNMFVLLYKYMRFFVLAFFGLCIAVIFPFYDLMEHKTYFTAISFFVGLFALTETYISYNRLPFRLLSTIRKSITTYIIVIQVVMMILRTILDFIIFILCFTGPDNAKAYIFVRAMRIVSGCLFTVTEFWVSKITMDVIATPRKDLTSDMKLQLKETKGKLQQLALANYVGGICAVIDIANHWVEIQMTQALVCFLGSTAYIFYGNLFRLSLEKEREHLENSKNSASRTHTATLSDSNKAHSAESKKGLSSESKNTSTDYTTEEGNDSIPGSV